MKALENIEEIFHVAFGYMASKALFSALHLGVFDALAEGTKQLSALVDATGTEERGLHTLLTALTALGLIQKTEAGWVNSPAAAENLASGTPGFLTGLLREIGCEDVSLAPFIPGMTRLVQAHKPG